MFVGGIIKFLCIGTLATGTLATGTLASVLMGIASMALIAHVMSMSSMALIAHMMLLSLGTCFRCISFFYLLFFNPFIRLGKILHLLTFRKSLATQFL